jgi:hypothetical protein
MLFRPIDDESRAHDESIGLSDSSDEGMLAWQAAAMALLILAEITAARQSSRFCAFPCILLVHPSW